MMGPYSYTVLRYVHDITTGEFINVGVALYAPNHRFLGALCRTTLKRLTDAFPELNRRSFKETMRYIQRRFEQQGALLRDSAEPAKSASVMEAAHGVLPADDS